MVLLGLMQHNTEREQTLHCEFPVQITADVSSVVFLAAESQYAQTRHRFFTFIFSLVLSSF